MFPTVPRSEFMTIGRKDSVNTARFAQTLRSAATRCNNTAFMSNSSHCWRENTAYAEPSGHDSGASVGIKKWRPARQTVLNMYMKKQTINKLSDCQPRADGSSVSLTSLELQCTVGRAIPPLHLRKMFVLLREWVKSLHSHAFALLCSAKLHPEEPRRRIEPSLSAVHAQLLQTPCERCDATGVLRSNNGLCYHRGCFSWETEAHPRPHLCFHSRTPSQNWTSKSTGREKRHKSVKTEEATGGGGGDSLQRSATFPGMRGFMMSGGGGGEGRAVGFRGRTTVAERRDQSMIVTEAWDWSSTPRSVPRTSYGLNVVSQRDSVTMHLPFVTAARNLE